MTRHRIREHIASCLPKLRSIARGLTGQTTTADDLVQSTLERALNRLDQVYDESRIDSWLYTILHSQWVDEIRKSNRRKNTTAQFTLLHNAQRTPVHHAGRDICRAMDIEKALSRLTSEQREVITLVHIAGYNYEETALILKLPVGTVASRVARGREKLAAMLHDKKKVQRVKSGS